MNSKFLNNWLGPIAVVWLLGAHRLLSYLVAHIAQQIPESLFILIEIVCWLGVGLLLAVSGVRRGSNVSRIFAMLAICIFVHFAWQVLNPPKARASLANNAPGPSLAFKSSEPK
jgi:hypothetical protein